MKKTALIMVFIASILAIASACGSSQTTTPPPTTTTTPPTTTTTTPPTTTTTTPPMSDAAVEGMSIFIDKACVACHVVQGIPEAQGTTGPELTNFASNALILDTLSNTEENLREYLGDPTAIKEGVIMPNQYLTDSQIEALVAFLQTLK